MKSASPFSEIPRARSEQKCPGCGRVLPEWPEEGFVLAGIRYCCQGCAEGSECTCAE